MIQQRGLQGKVEEYEKEVEKIDEQILADAKPKVCSRVEVDMVRNFERVCGLLTLHMGVQNPERLTVKRYYMRVADMEEMFKQKKNGNNGRKDIHQRHSRR